MANQSTVEVLQKKLDNAKKDWKKHKIPEYIKKYNSDVKRLKPFRSKKL